MTSKTIHLSNIDRSGTHPTHRGESIARANVEERADANMVIGGPGYIGTNLIADDFGIEKPWQEPETVKKAREIGMIRN